MPIAFLMAAICSGLTTAFIWIALGGSGLMAFVLYVLSGQLMMAGMVTHAALRGLR